MWNEIIRILFDMKIYNYVLAALIQAFFTFKIFKVLLNKDVSQKKFVINTVILAICCFILYLSISNFLRIIILFIIMVIQLKIMYKLKWSNSIIISLIAIFAYMIFEIIVVFVYILVFRFNNKILKFLEASFISSFIISFLSYLFIKLLRNKLVRLCDYFQAKSKLISIASLLLCFVLLSYNLGKNVNWKMDIEFVLNYLIIIVILASFYYLILEKIKVKYINDEYDTLFEYLKSLENLLEEYRIRAHEYKNDLINIRGLSGKNKKTTEFIDEIIKENNVKNNLDVFELINVPNGGLKGLLYYKISEMKRNNINVTINISNRIKRFGFSNLSAKNYKEISRLFAILLDNAYEASKTSHEKIVSIEIDYLNNQLQIIISNSFDGEIDLAKIELPGYSKKSDSRGYGLYIFKSIVNDNKKISQKREILDNIYYQYVYIQK